MARMKYFITCARAARSDDVPCRPSEAASPAMAGGGAEIGVPCVVIITELEFTDHVARVLGRAEEKVRAQAEKRLSRPVASPVAPQRGEHAVQGAQLPQGRGALFRGEFAGPSRPTGGR